MSILEHIHCSADIKKLSQEQEKQLCIELRKEIINDISKTGGHLASNLGAVELTVALHRVYDSSIDRLVFDVGHQCYTHKILTGRRDKFSTLRQLGGISGFPKPSESIDDACITGHASTSISYALGMARARSILDEKYDVCAIIGDGALTGGLAYEGLADCGESGEPIVIVLNDNAMSISENVGGLARFLARQRVRPGYIALKRLYHRTIGRYEPVYNFLHTIKERLKDLVIRDNLFEDMGFYYLGPIDGHDVNLMTRTIKYARELRVPVLVHVLTVKGKGYPPAEINPSDYHSVGPFNLDRGATFVESGCFSNCFGLALTDMARKDSKIVAITAAMTHGTGLFHYSKTFPERFFDIGIAEGHGVTMAAGLAKQGMHPVFAVYSSFLQRGYDELIHDVSIDHLHVVFAVDRSGLVGADGETHQGSFDVGFLCQVPGLSLWSPSNYLELQSMLKLAFSCNGPAAIRYPRGNEGNFRLDTSAHNAAILRTGDDITILTYGITINDVLEASDLLAKLRITADVIKLNRLDVLDTSLILHSVEKTKKIVIVEESAEAGSIGLRVLALLSKSGILAKNHLINLGDGIIEHGTISQLKHLLHMDAEGIASVCEELI